MAKVRREESQRKPKDESESPQGADAARVSVVRLVPNTTRGKPDWEYWSGMRKTGVADAVALSCDIDPRKIEMDNEARAPDLAQFWQRLEVAEASQGGHLKAEKQRYDDGFPDLWKVDLEVFAAWAEGLRPAWQLPEDFPGRTAKPEQSSAKVAEVVGTPKVDGKGGNVTVTLPHRTKTLDAVFEIMRKSWTNSDPGFAPKQTVIAAEIDKALGWRAQGDGKPSRGAQTLAAAIRPDDESDADNRGQGRRSDGTFRR